MVFVPGKIHGCPVLGWVQAGVFKNGNVNGYVLVEVPGKEEWVVSFYEVGADAWSSGNYFKSKSEALGEFNRLVALCYEAARIAEKAAGKGAP